MHNRMTTCLGSSLIGLSLVALPAAAHHGWGGQGSELFEVSGTVHAGVSFAGPHASMQIEDADGRIWDITLAPPSRTDRAGLDEDTLPVGAEVTITGMRNSDPERYEVKTARVSWNGTHYDVYPNRLAGR